MWGTFGYKSLTYTLFEWLDWEPHGVCVLCCSFIQQLILDNTVNQGWSMSAVYMPGKGMKIVTWDTVTTEAHRSIAMDLSCAPVSKLKQTPSWFKCIFPPLWGASERVACLQSRQFTKDPFLKIFAQFFFFVECKSDFSPHLKLNGRKNLIPLNNWFLKKFTFAAWHLKASPFLIDWFLLKPLTAAGKCVSRNFNKVLGF